MATHSEQRKLALRNLKTRINGINLLSIREMKTNAHQNPYFDEWKCLTSTDWYGDVFSEVDPLLKEIDRMSDKTDLQDTLIEWMGGAEVMEEAEEAHLRSMSEDDTLQAIFVFVLLSCVEMYR